MTWSFSNALQLVLVAAAFVIATAFMHGQQAVTRVEGTIRDEATGEPVGCKLYVVGPAQKKLTISSDALNGTYLMVLNDAGDYKVSLTGHMVYRREFKLAVPASKKFQEIKQDYVVRSVKEGDPVFATIGFERNTSSLSASGKKELNTLLDILKTNQEMNVIITVVPDEDLRGKVVADSTAAFNKAHAKWDKDMAAWKKKNKKKQTSEPPVEPVIATNIADPNEQIIKDRKVTVFSYLIDVKNSDLRVIVKSEPLPASVTHQAAPATTEPASSKKSKKTKTPSKPVKQVQTPAHNNLSTKIGKVKRLFE